MKSDNESVITSALRAFCVAFFAVVGVALSLFAVTMLLGLLSSNSHVVEKEFNIHIETNANDSLNVLHEAPAILELKIVGIIGAGKLTGERVRDLLAASRQDDRVKAVLLTINSPGGTVMDIDMIYRCIMEYKQKYKVPVYAFTDGLCASGGMYLACAADKIYATDNSLIGSIGVLSQFVNVSDLLTKIGVSTMVITEGKHKDDLNPLRPWAPGEELRWKTISAYYYDRFVSIVTGARRKVMREQLIGDYGAQVFPAPNALNNGLIDVAGATRVQVLGDLAVAAGVKEEMQVISLQEARLFSNFMNEESALLTGKVTHQLDLPMPMELFNQPLYYYTP